MYSKSQKLLANLDEDVMDADAFPIELDTKISSTSKNINNITCMKFQAGNYNLHFILYTYSLIIVHIYPTDDYTDLTLNESNSSGNYQSNPSRRYKRNRTSNNTRNNNTNTVTVTDDTESATQTHVDNDGNSAVYTVDRNQYEVDCILGNVLLIYTI